MEKPLPKVITVMDFNEMIRFSEEKNGFYHRDFLDKFGHFKKYIDTSGDVQLFDGKQPDCSGPNGGYTVYRNGKRREASKEEYDADFKLIHEQYQRYEEWCKTNPPPEYLDYWHWLTQNRFYDFHKGIRYWFLEDIIEDEDSPEWVRYITTKIRDDFMDYLDEDGGLKVLIDW